MSFGKCVDQWVKRWPTDLAVTSSSPAGGEIVSLQTGFHCTLYFLQITLLNIEICGNLLLAIDLISVYNIYVNCIKLHDC